MAIDPKALSILLVEDAAIMRKIEIKTLKSLGFEQVTEAVDGRAAVALLEAKTPVDLIISDWNMPNMDGLALLKWVRGQSRWTGLPFLMATGQGDKQQEQKAVDAGVSAFVAKPFNEDDLSLKIEEAFGLTRAKAETAAQIRARNTLPNGKVPLKVAHIQITDHLILGVLKHMIAKGEVVPEHFELETICMAGWNPVQDALENGTVDAAFVLAPIAMDLFGAGAAIRLVLNAHKSGSIFVRSRHQGYQKPYGEFFRGKSFLIPHKMSVHHMLAHLFFNRIGLSAGMVGEGRNDVHFEIVAPIKMQHFMERNPDTGGFLVAEPLGTRAIAGGAADQQFLSGDLWSNHPCCVVAMRDDFVGPYTDAVYEFTRLLVQAGQFIEKKPELAAEIGVSFLDPAKKLGLKVPILKNVLAEPNGIKTGDLYPSLEALKTMHAYMVETMGIGVPVDLDRLVDLRFADAACNGTRDQRHPAVFQDQPEQISRLLTPGEGAGGAKAGKVMLNQEGKYLTFSVADQEYGIEILKVREIIAMMDIRSIPQMPSYMRGVVNLRGRVIPVFDLKDKLGLGGMEAGDRSCIIVLDRDLTQTGRLVGLAVDSVTEVLAIKSHEIETTPSFGSGISTEHIMAVAKLADSVKLLLDIDNVLDTHELTAMEAQAV